MTLCNMSIEAGARAGMIAPDEVTFEYLKGRPRVPQGAAWDKAVAEWRKLPSDPGATYDREEKFDAAAIEPMITKGKAQVAELDDGWTVVTVDGSTAAHVEHSIALCDDGCVWVLTALDGGRGRLGDLITSREDYSSLPQ